MFAILWYILIIFFITSSVVWVIENNGEIIINWLGYQVQTDILTSILILLFLAVSIAFISYILTRLLAIKFPNLLKILFKKSYTKKLENIIIKHHNAFDLLTNLLLALEVDDLDNAKKIYQDFAKKSKFKPLKDFFSARFALENGDFETSEKLFREFQNNPHGKVLLLKSKLKILIKDNQINDAILVAQEILMHKKNSLSTARELLKLYKKNGNWQLAKNLIHDFGSTNFTEELQVRDTIILNSSLAQESYKSKKYFQAIRYAKLALNLDEQFLPANEILIKSWIKIGCKFKAISVIKYLWKTNPHIILIELYSALYKKNSPKKRIKVIKKLTKLNSNRFLANFAIGLTAFRSNQFDIAKDYINNALAIEKTQNLFFLLAYCEKFLNNKEEYFKNLTIAKMLPHQGNYSCIKCNKTHSRWSSNCDSCNSYDSLQWNN
jgi:HemY protein